MVSIYGSGFTGATSVSFNGALSDQITVESDSILIAVVPNDASSGEIEVVAPGGIRSAETTFNFIHNPTVAYFTPTRGAIGTDVTIVGDNLSSATTVSFGGITTSEIVVLSDTSIVAKVPTGADVGELAVVTMGGATVADSPFSVVHPPEISEFVPTIGAVGTLVKVEGANFEEGIIVRFGDTEAVEILVSTATTLEAVVPIGATTGRISVSTVGGSASADTKFTVVQPPTIKSLVPREGGVGSTISIAGSNFIDVTLVKLNEFSCGFAVKSSNMLLAEVPTLATNGHITIVTLAGTAVSEEEFTVLQAPSIRSFSPNAVPAGSTVTINGDGFSGATSVKLSGRDVAEYVVDSETKITATLGNYAVSGPITVTTAGGVASSDLSLHIISAPSIRRFLPASGGVGSAITVLGANLIGVTAVTVGGVSAIEFTELSDTELSVIIPSGVSSGVISVTTAAGTSSSSAKFGVLPAPVIKSFTPTIDGVGAKVMITGAALSGANLVKINETVATK